jgi:hypothetical protein
MPAAFDVGIRPQQQQKDIALFDKAVTERLKICISMEKMPLVWMPRPLNITKKMM